MDKRSKNTHIIDSCRSCYFAGYYDASSNYTPATSSCTASAVKSAIIGRCRIRVYRKAIRVWVVNILRIMTMLWLVAHFTLIITYVLPTNPAQDASEPFFNATIGKYFSQDWSLFAPDPVSADYALLVRPLSRNEFVVAQRQGLPNDRWYDLSSPLWTKFQSNRFSAYDRVFRPTADAILDYYSEQSQQSVPLMVKTASAFCKDIGQRNASYVALMIRERPSKLWSERGTSQQPVVRTTLVGIYPVDKSVENSHIYQP